MSYILLLITALIWGGNAIVTKASAGVISPAEIAFYRWVLAILILTPFVARQVWMNRAVLATHGWRLLILGLLGGAALPYLSYIAARYTSAMHLGIIQSLMPLLSLVLAIILLGHRMTYGALAGGIVSLLGVAVVASHGQLATLFTQGPNIGDAIMLAATVCYALYTVLLKRWPNGLPLLQSLYLQACAAAISLLPIYLLSPRLGISTASLPLIAYAGAAASVAAPLLWMRGIDHIGPARASLFFNFVPFVTAILAIPLLSEQLTASLVLGGALTMSGVILAELWRRPLAGENPEAGRHRLQGSTEGNLRSGE
ncbi:DMT family transporter [Rhizobium rhizogenes]|uniref:DMT family transporter n=1 Tax=Rhizobium rhizogenes TaxID=359 RepID=UPI00115C489F|nr:DMT family transporter [Rhizobium rhizogenes]NTF65205.1 DMT family transporter [Rhizobium rhizogenes]NTG04208.1 DMT family transporter [Rhizobium rhizogenes]NTG96553.1 DMT family transporter [Rhizobium rhizogenes]TRB24790.1 DMT family transporter [Rhizobium rhizogenes]